MTHPWAALMRTLACVATLLGLATGCLGGQTGSESEVGGAPVAECVDATRSLAWDERSPLGFSAAEVWPSVAGSRNVRLSWSDALAPASVAPEAGDVDLTITVSTPIGQPRWIHSVGRSVGESACPEDRLAFEAEVSFSTSPGALNETFAATFVSTDPGNARFAVSLPLVDLTGSFQVTPNSGYTTQALLVEAEFSANQTSGALRGELQSSNDPAEAPKLASYACWPAGSGACRAHGEP